MPTEVRIDVQVMEGTPGINAGQPVCDGPVNGGLFVQLATPAAIAATGGAIGIALTGGSFPSTITVATGGLVDRDLIGLGSGVACAVTADPSGNLVRIVNPSAVTDAPIIGYCDSQGNVLVQPRRLEFYNVRDFGARGDGITDDTAAFRALFTLIGRIFTDFTGMGYVYSGATVWVPVGRYRLTCTLELPPFTSIRGASPWSTLLQFDVTPSPNAPPWGDGILATNYPGSIGGGPIVIEGLGIINVRSGDPDTRSLGNGAGIDFIGGGPLCTVINCNITGWKKGIVCEATNSTLIERVNFGGMYGHGYPNTSDHPTKYNDSIGVWLSSSGIAALLDATVASDFSTIVAGDSLIVGKDQDSDITVTFQAGDTTLAAVISRINEAAGYAMAANHSGSLRFSGLLKNHEFGRMRVSGGTAVAKCGLEADETSGLGVGHGFFDLSGGLTNHIHIRNCQFNGPWIGIYEEDGAAHLITNNNFNAPGRMAVIRSFIDSVWESNESEGCQSDAYILFAGHGFIGQSITFQHNAISGSADATWIKFQYKDTLIYHFTCTGNGWYGLSGGRPYIDTKSGTNIAGRLILDPPNWGYQTTTIGHEQSGSQIRSFDAFKFGIGTVAPLAALDVRHTYSGTLPKATMMLRTGDDPSFFVATTFERWERGMKRQASTSIQQGIMELFERGDWSSTGPTFNNHRGPAPIGLDIDMIDGEVAELDIRVEMTAGVGGGCRVWRFLRLAKCDAGTVRLDTDSTDDRVRTIGSLAEDGSWIEPVITTAGRQVRVRVQAATKDFGQWLAYVESLQRSAY